MPRKCKSRKIYKPPMMMGFKPFGLPHKALEYVCLHFEEFESLRLVNYEKKSHEEAAANMEVSRPTFTRIYNNALQKLTKALVEGNVIKIEGGNYEFNSAWQRCKICFKLFEDNEKHQPCCGCKQYNEKELFQL